MQSGRERQKGLFLFLIFVFGCGGGGAPPPPDPPSKGVFVVFGPEFFPRDQGKPSTEVRLFNVKKEGTDHLGIKNGEEQGNNANEWRRVSSAVINLNGSEVVGPENFNQQVLSVEKEILLQSQNTLEVEVRSKPGSFVTIEILGFDTVPPQIQIVEPVDGSTITTANPSVTVTFSDDNSGIVKESLKVMANELDITKLFTVEETSATATLQSGTTLIGFGLPEDLNTITAAIQDRAGNEAVTTSNFTVTKGPQLLGFPTINPSAIHVNKTTEVRVTVDNQVPTDSPSSVVLDKLVAGDRSFLASLNDDGLGGGYSSRRQYLFCCPSIP